MDQIGERFDRVGDEVWALLSVTIEIVIVVVACSLLSRWIRRRVRRRFTNSALPDNAAALAENLSSVVIYIAGVTVLLGLWGASWQTLLTAFSLSSLALAIGLQDVLKSVVAGMLILVEQPFVVGDRIKVRDVEGTVEQISLRSTIIRADNGERIAAPNSLIFVDPVTNRSPDQRTRTILLVGGVEGSAAELKARAQAALADTPGLDSKIEIGVRVTRPKTKVTRAIDALPSIELPRATEPASAGVARAGLVRIAWYGSGTPAVRAEVKRRLAGAFPGATIKTGRW